MTLSNGMLFIHSIIGAWDGGGGGGGGARRHYVIQTFVNVPDSGKFGWYSGKILAFYRVFFPVFFPVFFCLSKYFIWRIVGAYVHVPLPQYWNNIYFQARRQGKSAWISLPAQRDFQDWQGFRHGFMIRTKHVCAPPKKINRSHMHVHCMYSCSNPPPPPHIGGKVYG